jgi:hypothetical protein
MTPKNNDKNDKIDETRALDNLIRAAGEKEPAKFVRPSNEAIQAYLEGTANDNLRAEVQQAMLVSASFRKEIAELAQDIEYIGGHKAAADFDAVKVSGKTLARIKSCAEPDASPPSSTRHSRAFGEALGSIANFFKPPVVRLATASAGVVAFVLIIATVVANQPQMMRLAAMGEYARPPASSFGTTRGSAGVEGQDYDWAAAKDSFDEMLTVEDGAVEIDRRAPAAASTDAARTIGLLLERGEGNANERFEISVPEEADSLALWVLLVPPNVSDQTTDASAQFVIKHQRITKDKIKVIWGPQPEVQEALITLTYRIDNKFFAARPVYIKP